MHILHIHYTTEFYLVQCICNSCCCFVWQWYCFYPFSKMYMHSRSVQVCCDYHYGTWRDWTHKIDTYVVPWVLSVFQLPSDTHQKLLPAKHIHISSKILQCCKFSTYQVLDIIEYPHLHKPLLDAGNIPFNPYKYVP